MSRPKRYIRITVKDPDNEAMEEILSFVERNEYDHDVEEFIRRAGSDRNLLVRFFTYIPKWIYDGYMKLKHRL